MLVTPKVLICPPKLMVGKLSILVFPKTSWELQLVTVEIGKLPFQYQLYVTFKTLSTFGVNVCASLTRNSSDFTNWSLAPVSGPPSVDPSDQMVVESFSVRGR